MDSPRRFNSTKSESQASTDDIAAESHVASEIPRRCENSVASDQKDGQPAARNALSPDLCLRDASYLQELRAELKPTTALESILVGEMARHAAAMEFCGIAAEKALRFGARHEELLGSGALGVHESGEESMFAAAITGNATDRVERYGQQHRRGFYRALGQLQLLREQRVATVAEGGSVFGDEAACETYLIGRMQASPRRCPGCNKRRYHYLKSRRRWECAACGAQLGLRAGTVMERSPLPLLIWFKAVFAVCADAQITATELARRMGLNRLATVRRVLGKIKCAIDSSQAEDLLAGLHHLAEAGRSPATGAPICEDRI